MRVGELAQGGPRQRALGYLTQPVVLVSIVLLAWNDAVWKGSGPGWLTGKLSDFAGLVFFSGLLALFIGLLPRITARHAGLVAWWSTAVVFALVKTVPAANAALISLIGLVRGPVQVVLDPTDVLALVVLPFGWLLWSRGRLVTRRSSLKVVAGWTAAPCAVLATGATSCGSEPQVERVVMYEGRLYADGDGDTSVSDDHGLTWTSLDYRTTPDPPPLQKSAVPAHRYAPPVPQACHPVQRDLCYRVESTTAIHGSLDAGATWAPAWTESAEEIAARVYGECGDVAGGAVAGIHRRRDSDRRGGHGHRGRTQACYRRSVGASAGRESRTAFHARATHLDE